MDKKFENLEKLAMIFEKKSNSFVGLYENHNNKIKLNEEDSNVPINEIKKLSELISESDVFEDMIIEFSEESVNEINVDFPSETINSNTFISDIKNKITLFLDNLFEDCEKVKIYSIIKKIQIDQDNVHITFDLSPTKFDFNNIDDDHQIKAIEDYLLLKKSFGLTYQEIKNLSKKQKRYLIYKIKNNLHL